MLTTNAPDYTRCHTASQHLRSTRHRRSECPVVRPKITRTDGIVTVTRTTTDTTATATQNGNGWDFVAMDDWGRIVAADTLPSYNAVLKAFKTLEM